MTKKINLYGDRFVTCLTWQDLKKLGISNE